MSFALYILKSKLGACLGKHFLSLNFRHSIFITYQSYLITHHSSLIFSHSFGNITFIFITQFFHTIHGSHTCQLVQYFFFSVTNSPKLILLKKKKKLNGQPRKRKKRVKRWSKVTAVGPICVFNYSIAIELWVMETKNSQKLFSVSITHNSKIRELSDGNRVIVCQTNFFAMGPIIFELWVIKIENWVIKKPNPNRLLYTSLYVVFFNQ